VGETGIESSVENEGAAGSRGAEWFLNELGRDRPDTAQLVDYVRGLYESEDSEAESCAELLQEHLSSAGRVDEALQLLQLRAERHSADDLFRSRVREDVVKLLGGGREARVIVEQSGFDSGVRLDECLRRVLMLRRLSPGAYCQDKTWGFGVVRDVDYLYARVRIDFEGRSGHEMSMAYAGESLKPAGEDHLMVRRLKDPEGIARLAAESPAELVRVTLQSYGPLTATRLREILVPEIVKEGAWKEFWDAARRELQEDAYVDFPRRRADPLRLRSEPRDRLREKEDRLKGERDPDVILDLLEEDARAGVSGDRMRAIFVDRLKFVVRARAEDPGSLARLVVIADEFGMQLPSEGVDVSGERLLDKAMFVEACRNLSGRRVAALCRLLLRGWGARAEDILLASLEDLPYSALNEVLGLLLESNRREECLAMLREIVGRRRAGIHLLLWIMRNTEVAEAAGITDMPHLALMVVAELGKPHSGDDLKAANLARRLFMDADWLDGVLTVMTPEDRLGLVRRIAGGSAWKTLDRRSLLGRIIKKYPELEEALATSTESEQASPRRRTTSQRSYAQRQAQLQKLVQEEIPRISREIARARSYGDLSENHEYKAAKEMQAFLMRRRSELEKMLEEVRPDDFSEAGTEVVGPGTEVELECADGGRQRVVILGMWDRDEALGIISSESPLARVLEGHRVGETVSIPGETGSRECRISAINGLSDEVRRWMGEVPEP